MNTRDIIIAFVGVLVLYAVYFLGRYRGRCDVQRATPQAERPCRRRPTWRGMFWAGALPASYVLLYFSLAGHLRLALGRWPERIGDNPASGLFHVHSDATWWLAVAIAYSVAALPLAFVVCLLVRRWFWVATYLAGYCLSVLVAFGLMYLAPRPFVTWFWD